jgi:lysophospholipase L1-like esterase
MRARLIVAALALLAGCGEAAAAKGGASEPVAVPVVARPVLQAMVTAPASPAASSSAPATSPPPSTSSAPAVGHLDGWTNLDHLFESLAAIDDGHGHDDVRAVWFGDSHTAADVVTATTRHILQGRFGDGGRGFVSLGRPWKTYYAEGVHGFMFDFEPAKTRVKDGRHVGDGCYGLLGVSIETSHGGARAWSDVTTATSHVEISYLQQPQGGSFDVLVDGAKAGRVATQGARASSGFYGLDLTDAPHQIAVQTLGDGEVRIFGMVLDRPRAGVVVDELGINGAQAATLLHESEEHFSEQLRHRAPDVVILAYGTNEALEANLTDAEYERRLVDLLGRVERAAPSTSCLLVGPPDLARRASRREDWKTWPRLLEIVALQRRVAQAAKCAFFDQLEAMGGPGSMATWASEFGDSRGSPDRVHLRKSGYVQVGTSFASDLMRAYDEWRAVRGLPPTGAPATWTAGAHQ